MAEPLSTISGVAGVISLGITACQGLIKYINSFAGASETVQSTIKSATFLGGLLLQIQVYLKSDSLSHETKQLVVRCVLDCQSNLLKLDKKARKLIDQSKDASKSKVFAQRSIFPFREHKLLRLLGTCQELKRDLTIALNTLNIDIGHASLDRMDDLDISISAVQSTVSGAERTLESLANNQSDALFAEVSKWLSPRLYGESEQKQREAHNLIGRQNGFARTVKTSAEFRSWYERPGQSSGAVACRAQARPYLPFATDGRGIAYLFCSYSEWERHTAVALLGHINQQLLGVRRSLFSRVQEVYQWHAKDGSRPLLNEQIELLRMLSEGCKTVIVVDALDELTTVDDCRQTVVEGLCRLCPSISLLVTSRPLPNIEEMLAAATRIEVKTTAEDMRGYLEYRLPKSETMRNHTRRDPTLISHICDTVIEKSEGMFLLARLYLDALTEIMTPKKLKQALKTLPDGLWQVYDNAIGRIQAQGKHRAPTAMLALSWIAFSRRPLSLRELQTVLAVEPGDTDVDEENMPEKADLLAACTGIVIYNEQTDIASLVHYTLQEYFEQRATSLFDEFKEAHTNIARTCLTIMLFEQYNNAQSSPGQPAPESRLALPLLTYAARHWGSHQHKSGSKSNMPLVLDFLHDSNRVTMACCLMIAEDKLFTDSQKNARSNIQGLSLAAYLGLSDAVNELVSEGMMPEAKDSLGWSALHWAAAGGQLDTTKALIEHHADVNVQDELGWTPLHHATRHESPAVAKLLIVKGANVNGTDRYGGTPLYRAASYGSAAIVDLLLEKNADTEILNQYKQTAMHRAAAGGYLRIVQALVARGANRAPKDDWGYTPRILATDNEHEQVAQLLPLPYRRR